MDENTLFTLLSHPLRRKILRELYQYQRVSFSMMSDWGVKTGTLYFHLKELRELVGQDQEKLYLLTSKGKEVCQWLFGQQSSRATIDKINSFSFLIRPIYHLVDQSMIVHIIILLLTIAGIIGAGFARTMLLGPIILPAPDKLGQLQLILLNLSMIIIQTSLATIAAKLLGRSYGYSIVFFVLLGNIVVYLFIVTVFVLILVPQFGFITVSIPLWGWYLLSTVSQIISILTVSGALLLGAGMKPERALLIGLILLYLSLFVSTIL